MRVRFIAIAAMAMPFGAGSITAQANEFLPKRVTEKTWIDLAGGISARVERVAAEQFKDFRPTNVPVAVRLSLKGPADGFGVMTMPSTNPKQSGVKLTIGRDAYAPLMIDHPIGGDNIHKIEAPGDAMSFLQGYLKGEDYFVFLFDVPQSAKGLVGKFDLDLMLGRLMDTSKGNFQVSVEFVLQ